MAYIVPPFEEIRAAYLRDLLNLEAAAHVAVDSDNFVRASATASAADGLYHHQNWIARQILPDTADPENVERHAALRGLSRKPATRAAGTVTLTANGDVFPFEAGQRFTHAPSGETFITTEGFSGTVATGTVAAGAAVSGQTVTLACAAERVGAMPEYTDEPVILQSAPLGVSSQAVLTLSGGTDAETTAALLARLIFYMRNPPGGGTAGDYERWAMAVPGVTWAKCFPLRRGPGTVDVVVASEEGLPSPETLTAVQNALNANRPVACPDCLALSPVLLTVNVTAKIRTNGEPLPVLQPRVEAALARCFAGLLPGDSALVSRMLAAMMDVPGVRDAELVTPASNTVAEALRWPRFGSLTLEGL